MRLFSVVILFFLSSVLKKLLEQILIQLQWQIESRGSASQPSPPEDWICHLEVEV